MSRINWRTLIAPAIFFGVVGPLIGGICAFIIGAVTGLASRDPATAFLIAMLLSYRLAWISALITGALTGFMAERTATPMNLAFKSALAGGVLSGLSFGLRSLSESNFGSWLMGGSPAVLIFAGVGALAAFVTTLIALKIGILRPAEEETA